MFVQPSAYGFDNSCMFDAMRELDPAIRRGIIDLDETATTDGQLADWNELGVRGIRVNISPVRKPEAGLAASMLPRIARLAALCRELGWHLDFLTPGWLVSELMPTLRELPVEFSVAHFGLYPAKDGVAQRGFKEFLSLVGDGSKRCWVKLTGIYRFSTAPGFADVKPIAQALMATAPGQLIWGSDFPHLSFHDRVGTIQLYNLLGEWAPEPATRKLILADNPASRDRSQLHVQCACQQRSRHRRHRPRAAAGADQSARRAPRGHRPHDARPSGQVFLLPGRG